jgi:hypothetical protein
VTGAAAGRDCGSGAGSDHRPSVSSGVTGRPFNPPNPTPTRAVATSPSTRPTAGDRFADGEADALIGDTLPFLNGPEPGGWTGDVWDGQPGDPDA